MANKRREANRRRRAEPYHEEEHSRNGMHQREPEHREAQYDGEGYRADGQHGERKGYSGSPAHVTMSHGPGPVPGAGELGGIGGPGPGDAARRTRVDPTENPIRKTPASATPKGDKGTVSGEED